MTVCAHRVAACYLKQSGQYAVQLLTNGQLHHLGKMQDEATRYLQDWKSSLSGYNVNAAC